QRHAQGTTEGLEHGLDLVVGVGASQGVDVQGHQRVIGKALEEFLEQVNVKTTDSSAGKRHVHGQTRAPREVDHYARQRFIQRDIGMVIAGHAFFVADGLGESLAEGDTNIFHSVVIVDVGVAVAFDIKVDQAMTGDLIEHMLEKRHAYGEAGLASAIQ